MILKRFLCLMLLLALLAACGGNAGPTATPTATTVPGVEATSEPPPTQPPAPAPLLADTVAPPATIHPTEPSGVVPTDTMPAPTSTSAPQPAQPRATATSSGPLQAAIYVANCRSAPSAEKPGRVIIQISVEATGGNGKYRYSYQNKDYTRKFIDVIGEKGTRSIGEVIVTSGDQQIKQEFDIAIGQLNCP
jgi:hypothetical protein